MKLIFTLFFVFTISACFSQKQNVYFLKNNGSYVSKKDNADYYRVMQEPDSGSTLYNVSEYYKNGQKKLIGKSSKVSVLVLQGQVAGFFPNGKKRFFAHYKDGHKDGMAYEYYPNGKIHTVKDYSYQPNDTSYRIVTCIDSTGKVLVNQGEGYYIGFDKDFKYITDEGPVKNGLRDGAWKGSDEVLKVTYTERYDNGKLLSGTAIDAAGKQHEYQQRFIQPRFHDGEKALHKYVQNEINILRDGIAANINGTAFISFIIIPGGKVDHIEISNSASESMNDDLRRLIYMSAKRWDPALIYGIPQRCVYTLPFTLRSYGQGDLFE